MAALSRDTSPRRLLISCSSIAREVDVTRLLPLSSSDVDGEPEPGLEPELEVEEVEEEGVYAREELFLEGVAESLPFDEGVPIVDDAMPLALPGRNDADDDDNEEEEEDAASWSLSLLVVASRTCN